MANIPSQTLEGARFGTTRLAQVGQGAVERLSRSVGRNLKDALSGGTSNVLRSLGGSPSQARSSQSAVTAAAVSKLADLGMKVMPGGRVLKIVASERGRKFLFAVVAIVIFVSVDLVNAAQNNPLGVVDAAIDVTVGNKSFVEAFGEEACENTRERIGVDNLECDLPEVKTTQSQPTQE